MVFRARGVEGGSSAILEVGEGGACTQAYINFARTTNRIGCLLRKEDYPYRRDKNITKSCINDLLSRRQEIDSEVGPPPTGPSVRATSAGRGDMVLVLLRVLVHRYKMKVR